MYELWVQSDVAQIGQTGVSHVEMFSIICSRATSLSLEFDRTVGRKGKEVEESTTRYQSVNQLDLSPTPALMFSLLLEQQNSSFMS